MKNMVVVLVMSLVAACASNPGSNADTFLSFGLKSDRLLPNSFGSNDVSGAGFYQTVLDPDLGKNPNLIGKDRYSLRISFHYVLTTGSKSSHVVFKLLDATADRCSMLDIRQFDGKMDINCTSIYSEKLSVGQVELRQGEVKEIDLSADGLTLWVAAESMKRYLSSPNP